MVLAGINIADKFMAKNAQKKVETFTNNLNAEKARELSNYKQASAFNKELDKYRTENPSINFDDISQYDKGGLIYNAISNKHADDTRSRYATGIQGSFVDAEGKELSEASTNWQKEIERRTANSIKSLQASYNKYKGYLNTTDIALESRYKQILDQGTNDLMSANNTSSIRKLLNKFGITESNNKNLTEIEKGGVKANINPELAKRYNVALQENAENFKKYKDWLDTKDKGYNLNEKDIEIKQTADSKLVTFNTFTGPADLVARTFRVVKKDKVQKDTFTTYTSPNLIKLTNTKNANNETPLKGMDIEGNDDVSLTDIWGKLTREQKLFLENNIKSNYADQLVLDEKRIKAEDGILKATGSMEELVEHTQKAILETVSYDIDKGEYNVVRYEDLDQLNNAEGKEVPKSISIKYNTPEGVVVATPVRLATEVINTLNDATTSASSKINLVNQTKQKISDFFPDDQEEQKNLFLQEFDTVLKRTGYVEEELTYTQADIESGKAENLNRTQDIRETLDQMEKARLTSQELQKLKRTLPAAEYTKQKLKSDRADAFLKSFENEFELSNLPISTQPFAGLVIPSDKFREQEIFNLDPERVQNFLDTYDYTSTEVKKKSIEDNTIRTGRTENVLKLINAHITAKNDDGTPRFLITNKEKAINNLLNKFLPAVIEIESDGDPKAKSSISSASGLLQFLMPSEEYPKGSASPALNRVEKYLGKREWGEELRKHGDASLLTAEQQVELFIGNILEKTVVIRDLDADGNIQYNKKGKILTKKVPGLGDKLMQKVFDGDMKGMLEAYYKIHHTNPDRATIKRAEKIFSKYF
jgi:hypothetical protein